MKQEVALLKTHLLAFYHGWKVRRMFQSRKIRLLAQQCKDMARLLTRLNNAEAALSQTNTFLSAKISKDMLKKRYDMYQELEALSEDPDWLGKSKPGFSVSPNRNRSFLANKSLCDIEDSPISMFKKNVSSSPLMKNRSSSFTRTVSEKKSKVSSIFLENTMKIIEQRKIEEKKQEGALQSAIAYKKEREKFLILKGHERARSASLAS